MIIAKFCLYTKLEFLALHPLKEAIHIFPIRKIGKNIYLISNAEKISRVPDDRIKIESTQTEDISIQPDRVFISFLTGVSGASSIAKTMGAIYPLL